MSRSLFRGPDVGGRSWKAGRGLPYLDWGDAKTFTLQAEQLNRQYLLDAATYQPGRQR